MKSLASALVLAITASAAAAQPPPRELFEDTPTTITGEIVRAELSAPQAKLHIIDKATGKPWVIEGPSSNTLLRGGIDAQAARGTVIVMGYQSKDKVCAPECRIRMRELTFPDGRKVFLGASGTGRS